MNVPFAAKLPKPQDLIAGAYDFAEQMLASQRKLAEDVLQATVPLPPGKDDAPANAACPGKPELVRTAETLAATYPSP